MTDSVGISSQFGGICHKLYEMNALSEQTVVAYERRMERAGVPVRERVGYLRWVRFYLDFCQKYGHPPREASSIPLFLEKLASKQQPAAARSRASQAVHLLLQRGTRPAAVPERIAETCPQAQDLEGGPDATHKSSFNLQSRLLTVHDGKGQKDRTVPWPERVMLEIREQMDMVRETLRVDIEAGFAGTFLPRQLGKNMEM